MKTTRRAALQAAGTTVLSQVLAAQAVIPGPRGDTRDTPKITLWLDNLEDAAMRRVRQLGVEYVSMGGPPVPWDEAMIRSRMDKLKTSGLTLFNMMFSGFPN